MRAFGTVGPVGEMPILVTEEASEKACIRGTEDPDFFVVDDMYDDKHRAHIVECSPKFVTKAALEKLTKMLSA